MPVLLAEALPPELKPGAQAGAGPLDALAKAFRRPWVPALLEAALAAVYWANLANCIPSFVAIEAGML